MTFTDTSLGAVSLGMSRGTAKEAAGMELDDVGDGLQAAPTLPPGLAELFFIGDPVECLGAQENGDTTQRVSVHGISLGDSGSEVVKVYGSAAQYIPAPQFGRTPVNGYVVSVGAHRLAFVLADGPTSRIQGIKLGPPDLTPSTCGG